MSLIILADARVRVASLPADDDAAQDIIDEQEAWLARRIGLLQGERTETFYVGLGEVRGKLGLARYTSSVTVTDGGTAVDASLIRLIDRGSAVIRTYDSPSRYWTGPYVLVTYTPNDLTEVKRVLYDLIGLSSEPLTPYESEQIGSYSYRRGGSAMGTSSAATRAALVSSLLPKHDQALTLVGPRRLGAGDPVINRPESEDE